MKLCLFFFFICGIFTRQATSDQAPEIKEEDNVLVLTENNFDHVVVNNRHLLVEFYAPWCGHCKALAPEYAKAATTLKSEESDIKLAKADATIETALAKKFGVKGYPTLKFFKNGKPQEYKGGRKADEIIAWVKKKTGPPCKVLSSEDEVKSFKTNNEVAVIGHFASAEDQKFTSYEEVAGGIDDLPFAVIYDSAVAGKVEVPLNNVVLFKQAGPERFKSALSGNQLSVWIIRETSSVVQEMSQAFDEGRADYEGDIMDTNELTTFVKGNQLRLVTEFTQESAPRIFGGDIHVHNLLFISKSSADFEKHLEAFKQSAVEFKGKVLFIFIDVDQDDNKRVMEFFGLKSDEAPVYRIIKMSDNMSKYKPDTMDLSKEAITAFTSEVLDGKAKRHLMSQEIPEDWNKNPVTVLVGKNFRDVVFDKSKKVFVEFYAPWCGHCKSLKPTWEKLGEHFKDNDEVVIAMMDATANEVEGFQISGFPTLKFIPSGSDKILDYNGDRSVEAMAEFVESNGQKVGDDQAEEEEVDQVRPTTAPLPPLETGPGGPPPQPQEVQGDDGKTAGTDSAFKKNIEDSLDPSLKLDNIKAKMMDDLKKVEEDLHKKRPEPPKQEL